MLAFRLIARLDIRNEFLIKTRQCEGVRKVGDPAEYAERYDAAGIDEIIFLDVVASLYGRNSLAGIVGHVGESVFVPLSSGGGIGSIDGSRALFLAGADKIILNSAAVHDNGLLSRLARKFGSQAVVLQLDAKRRNGSWEAYCEGARQPTGRDAIEWAREAVDRGAGEILVTSIDREGTSKGFDLDLVRAVSSAVTVPVVAAGGFGQASDALAAQQAGASGVAIAGALHYNRVKLDEIRAVLAKAGVNVRCGVSSPVLADLSAPIS